MSDERVCGESSTIDLEVLILFLRSPVRPSGLNLKTQSPFSVVQLASLMG